MSNTHFDHFEDHHDLRERDHGIAGGDHDDDYDSLKKKLMKNMID